MDPRGTAGIISGCARNLRSGNVIVFGWPDPTYPSLEFHIETMFKSSPPDVKKCFAPLPCKVLSSNTSPGRFQLLVTAPSGTVGVDRGVAHVRWERTGEKKAHVITGTPQPGAPGV